MLFILKKNGDKAMFPKWEKMPIKNEMPMGTGDYIRETIDKDLED